MTGSNHNKTNDTQWRLIALVCVLLSVLLGCSSEDSSVGEPDWDAEMLAGMFKKKVTRHDELLYPEVTNLEQLSEATQRIFMPAGDFFDVTDRLEVGEMTSLSPAVVKLDYSVAGSPYEAYSYSDIKETGSDTAYLVIPGSGVNEAGKIFYGDADDYHCCLREGLKDKGDLYVYVKPNNDFLAIHNNGRVLNGKVALFPQLLVMGGSYSTRYLVDAIALAQDLKGKYKKVIVIGLSQGGTASMLIALHTNPDAAVVASGYSVMNAGEVYYAGINQIVIPELFSVYTPSYIRKAIDSQKTRYLFSFGKAEAGAYGYESVGQVTQKWFSANSNMDFHYHEGGHVYPVEAILQFIDKVRAD